MTDEEWNRLIDAHRSHLHGDGPEPDLSGLSPADRTDIRDQFKIIDALTDRGPSLPPIDQDPVAIRLGLEET